MPADVNAIWYSLAVSPLAAVAFTFAVFVGASKLYAVRPNWHFLNPVLISIIIIISTLLALGIEYSAYADAVESLNLLLGPTTVALAVPLYNQLSTLKSIWFAVIVAVAGGSLIGIGVTVAVATSLGAQHDVVMALSLRSITTPIAVALSGDMGADPALTAGVVMLTGVVGATLCSWLFKLFGVNNEVVQGIAIGTSAHAIGTARAFQISAKTGAFSGLAMMVAGVFTALVLPWLVAIF